MPKSIPDIVRMCAESLLGVTPERITDLVSVAYDKPVHELAVQYAFMRALLERIEREAHPELRLTQTVHVLLDTVIRK